MGCAEIRLAMRAAPEAALQEGWFSHLPCLQSREARPPRLTTAISDLLRVSPVMAGAVAAGRLRVVGARYDLDRGLVALLA